MGGSVTYFQPGSISDTKIGSITFLYLGIFPMIVLRCLFIEINRPGGLSSAPEDLALKIWPNVMVLIRSIISIFSASI